ncbi:hypothetical protein Tsubulata_015319 [Turnera subulata]|uniref:Uncharacterized protein n=1 Tax=Turnera subulata TaxID=218843 RepID=A0A9Q0FQC6_9ROSI|nr:hypothetical protein Tsubulata_015319 [Turnera subulata]
MSAASTLPYRQHTDRLILHIHMANADKIPTRFGRHTDNTEPTIHYRALPSLLPLFLLQLLPLYLPSPVGAFVNSPTAAPTLRSSSHEISIRNRLVKQATAKFENPLSTGSLPKLTASRPSPSSPATPPLPLPLPGGGLTGRRLKGEEEVVGLELGRESHSLNPDIKICQVHPRHQDLPEILHPNTLLLLLKQWLEEELILNRVSLKETQIDSVRNEITQLYMLIY